MNANVMQVKMLEIFETSEVIRHQNGNNFAVEHLAGTVTVFFANSFENSLQKSSATQKIAVILSVVSKLIAFVYFIVYQL
jgi:hypothetical protein